MKDKEIDRLSEMRDAKIEQQLDSLVDVALQESALAPLIRDSHHSQSHNPSVEEARVVVLNPIQHPHHLQHLNQLQLLCQIQ